MCKKKKYLYKNVLNCYLQAHLDTMDSTVGDTTEEAAHLKHERRTSGDFKNGSSNEVNTSIWHSI